MRELAALRMVWAAAAWMAVEILATCYMVREEAAGGRATLAVPRVVLLSVAPGRRVWRASRRRMVMNEAAAPSPARGGASGFAFGVPNQHRGVPFNWFLFERRQTRRGTSAANTHVPCPSC